MFKQILMLLFILLPLADVRAQQQVVQFEELEILQKAERRPVLVFLQTDWCTYCKALKHTMRSNQKLAEMLNKNFYVVMFNPEEQRAIRFAGREFRPDASTGNQVQRLAEELGTIEGRLAYPTLCFLNPENEIIYQQSGYLSAKALSAILSIIEKAY